jgi:hypothetical protein
MYCCCKKNLFSILAFQLESMNKIFFENPLKMVLKRMLLMVPILSSTKLRGFIIKECSWMNPILQKWLKTTPPLTNSACDTNSKYLLYFVKS